MDKPKLLKDHLISGVAKRMQMSEQVVEAVVMHQFKGIVKAFQTCHSVEMTGFGKFLFQPLKANKVLKALETEVAYRKEHGVEWHKYQERLEVIESDIEKIKNHLKNAGEVKKHSRRLEEHNSEG